MEKIRTTCLVIGAGVVGLACARDMVLAGIDTVLIEKENKFGTGISSRSSEVIHAGIYYPQGSLKARLSVEGRARLYAYCQDRHIPHKNCGKIIALSHPLQKEKLVDIKNRALACGVTDLQDLSADDIKALEPEVMTLGGLLSPSTGIVDSHSLMDALLTDFQAAGGTIAFKAPFLKATTKNGLFSVYCGGDDPCVIETRMLVNAAGLGAISVLHALQGFPPAHIPTPYYAKGNYFLLQGRVPFRHLVYPIPEEAGLGIHATLDMGGACRFGPDVEWVTDPSDLSVNPARMDSFKKAIRSYWPGLPNEALVPGYAGMRPKLQAPGQTAADFVIQDDKIHTIHGLINLLGIESPGLTSSLAIAAHVKGLLLS